MAYTSGGCHDLRKFQNDKVVMNAFSKIISGKLGYVAVDDRREEEKNAQTAMSILKVLKSSALNAEQKWTGQKSLKKMLKNSKQI